MARMIAGIRSNREKAQLLPWILNGPHMIRIHLQIPSGPPRFAPMCMSRFLANPRRRYFFVVVLILLREI
jgi:hypothetical protein